MTVEQMFMLVTFAIVVITIAVIQLEKNRHRIRQLILTWLKISPAAVQGKTWEIPQGGTASAESELTPEESEAELERLQNLIDDQKKIARDTDIAYHLWGLYKSLEQQSDPKSLEHFAQDGEWYDVKILQVSTENGLSKYVFELKGARYTFVDDEEQQAWRVNMKYFSLFLYDDAGRCLIEIPMKTSVDGLGRTYSIASGGPKAFLTGSWINDFIYVTLKQQRMRNQEIRAQKHQERLVEIEDLKGRFGIDD